jgi:hypothetical protein
MANHELLEKVINTTQIGAGSGGLMNAKQANRFIDYVVGQSVLIADARLVRMVEPTQDIDKVNVGTRILRKATEGVDDGVNTDATFTKISMTTVKLRLDWELTTEGLEDNIEGTGLEDHVANLMATQTANDLEDLFIHGDTTSSDPLLKSLDGWRKNVRTNGHVVDASGANLSRAVFDRALRNLPNKFLQQRSRLKWYTSSGLVQDYLWSLAASTTTGDAFGSSAGTAASGAPGPGSSLGEAILAGLGGASGGANGATGVRPFGIPLWEAPLMEENEAGTYSGTVGTVHGVLDLTFPQNRIVGIQRDIVVYREFKPKKDAIEYTQFIRATCQVEHGDAWVHVRNIKARSL